MESQYQNPELFNPENFHPCSSSCGERVGSVVSSVYQIITQIYHSLRAS